MDFRLGVLVTLILMIMIGGCSDPLDLPATRKNLSKVQKAAKWPILTGVHPADTADIVTAQTELIKTWSYLDGLVNVEATGFTAFCTAKHSGDMYSAVPHSKTFRDLIELHSNAYLDIQVLFAKKEVACTKYSVYLNNRLVKVEATPPQKNSPTTFVV